MVQLEYVILYFIYGLAFFVMGLTSLLNYSKTSFLLLRRNLLYLGLFGLIHGFTEWLIMFNRTGLFIEYNELLSFLISSTFTISFLCLSYFGFYLVKFKKVKPLYFNIIVVIFSLSIVLNFILYYVSSQGYLSLDYFEFRFINRILSALPASLLTSFALFTYAHDQSIKHLGKVRQTIYLLGFFFSLYTISVGFIGENVNILWASSINSETFLFIFKIPVELVRITSAISISICVLFIIKEFDIEKRLRTKETEALYVRSFEHKKTASLLHDVVLQHLFAINLKIDEHSKKHHENTTELTEAKSSIQHVMHDIRNYLNSPIVRHVSIQELQNELQTCVLKQKQKFKDIEYSFTINSLLFGHQNTTRLDHIKHILNECVENAIRHSNATKISVKISVENNNLFIIISDNGHGISKQTQNGYGIISIQHRIKMCDGEIHQDTTSKGTTYEIQIPWLWEAI